MCAKLRLLAYMAKMPYWHTGLSLARNAEVSRLTVYFHLAALEDAGLVESRPSRNELTFTPLPQRPVYRCKLVEREEPQPVVPRGYVPERAI